MHTNMRHGGGQGPPNFSSGRGILGEMPGMFPGPGGFNQNNAMLGGNIQRPNMPNMNNQGAGPRFGPMNNRAMGGFGKGDSQHIPSLMQQNMFMGKMAQQQPQQQQQQIPHSQMTAQHTQGFQNPTQNIRDTQLNIVNNLLKGAISGGNGPGLGSMNNNGGTRGNSNSILGSFPARPPGPIPGNNFGGMKPPFMQQGQTSMPPRPLLPGFGQFNNNNGPGIPSIFDINTNPSNMSNTFAQRKRNPGFNNEQFAPAMKRNRLEQRQFPPGGTFIQNQANDRPAIRNDSFKRSASRFSVGRRDSSGSNQSERSQSSHGQNNRGSARRNSKGDYDPANPTNSRSGSVDSTSVQEQADGDFSVTIDSKGRSVSDRKEERKSSAKGKKSPFFCHTCNVDCNDKQNFSDHMQSDFHKERMEGLLNLTQQKSNHLQARIAAEAHLRNIEGKGDNHDRSAFCKTCNSSFTGSVVQHRQSDEHQDNAARHKEKISGDDNSTESYQKRDVDKLASFDGETSHGEDFIVAVSGFYCKLCRHFYKWTKITGAQHCRSRSHYNKYQEWLKKTESCHGNGTITLRSPGSELNDVTIINSEDDSNQGNSRFSLDMAECENSNHSDDFQNTNPPEEEYVPEETEDVQEEMEDVPEEMEDVPEEIEDKLLSDQ